jgi:hypothetical protein
MSVALNASEAAQAKRVEVLFGRNLSAKGVSRRESRIGFLLSISHSLGG